MKNVVAIGAGVCDGLGLGHNALAALITRGLAEISRLAVSMGASPQTLSGLAGLGDLVLTCTDDQSRNRRFGLLLAAGKTPEQALAEIGINPRARNPRLSRKRLNSRSTSRNRVSE